MTAQVDVKCEFPQWRVTLYRDIKRSPKLCDTSSYSYLSVVLLVLKDELAVQKTAIVIQ